MSPLEAGVALLPQADVSTRGWKMRLEDPVSRFFRYPIAKLLVRWLVRTSITPNQVTLVQPLLAAAAGFLITSESWWKIALAAVIFEFRSILDCVDGTLARATKLASPGGHAIDGIADWLSVLFLYAGIFRHFQLHPPSASWGASMATSGVVLVALFQGAIRSFASDYYKLKYVSIFERGRDETTSALREKMLALSPRSGLFAHIEVFIGRMGHLAFEHAWFDPHSQISTTEEQVRELRRNERSTMTKLIALLWSLSNGDTFITLVCLSAVCGKLWEAQVFFASIGVLWISVVILLNGWFIRSAQRRGSLTEAPAE